MPRNPAGPYDRLSQALAVEVGVAPGLITSWEATGDGSGVVSLVFHGVAEIPITRFNELVDENPPLPDSAS